MSNNNYTAKKFSFWEFIQENEIEIPIIQRDYAHGREGKESLRKNFLADLKKALDNEKPYNNKVMKLDFVYGSIEHQKMNPLDGQQRLTTLWLLHWFIALRAGKLGEVAKTLNRFSYETRISSREFCSNLCNPEHFTGFNGNDIVGFITKQIWFYSAWKQDPTIQSMLRMLGGTKITDKKGEDIIDGIEELFDETKDFEVYWTRLTSKTSPIVFYHLPLKDFGLSDDLYIKMNARGKQLTSFENFKADLVGYITEQSESELLDENMKNKWRSLLNENDGIPIKMDTTWTDIFWRNMSDDNKIDEIYFAFLNRFFWDKLFMYKKDDGKYVLDIGKGDESSTQENENLSYKYLNNSEAGQNVYDTTIAYKELDVYKFFNSEIPYSVFEDLLKILDRNTEIPICAWDASFSFIPKYEKDNNGDCIEITDNNGEKIRRASYLNQVQRVVFHAVCKYLIDGKADENSLKQWMRVVWNLVSGEDSQRPQIRSTSAMRSAMEFIDRLDSHDIYNSLDKFTDSLSDSAFDRRCKEEIAKAKQILHGSQREDGRSWEDIIIEAEKTAFFKGSIRFLYQDENGDIKWEHFDKKLDNARKFFKKDIIPTIELAKHCSDNQIISIWSKYSFNSKHWKQLLLDSSIYEPIHNFLMNRDSHMLVTPLLNDIVFILKAINTQDVWLLDNWMDCRYVLTNYSQRRKEPSNGWVFEVGNRGRNHWNRIITINQGVYSLNKYRVQRFIAKNSNHRIHPSRHLSGCPYLDKQYYKIFAMSKKITIKIPKAFGAEKYINNHMVYFSGLWTDIKYNFNNNTNNSYYFRFFGNGYIFLMNDNWEEMIIKDKTQEDTLTNRFFRKIDRNETIVSFINKLNQIIHEVSNKYSVARL